MQCSCIVFRQFIINIILLFLLAISSKCNLAYLTFSKKSMHFSVKPNNECFNITYILLFILCNHLLHMLCSDLEFLLKEFEIFNEMKHITYK